MIHSSTFISQIESRVVYHPWLFPNNKEEEIQDIQLTVPPIRLSRQPNRLKQDRSKTGRQFTEGQTTKELFTLYMESRMGAGSHSETIGGGEIDLVYIIRVPDEDSGTRLGV